MRNVCQLGTISFTAAAATHSWNFWASLNLLALTFHMEFPPSWSSSSWWSCPSFLGSFQRGGGRINPTLLKNWSSFLLNNSFFSKITFLDPARNPHSLFSAQAIQGRMWIFCLLKAHCALALNWFSIVIMSCCEEWWEIEKERVVEHGAQKLCKCFFAHVIATSPEVPRSTSESSSWSLFRSVLS